MVRTAIIGMGVTGYSCLRYLAGVDELVVVDTRSNPPNGALAQNNYPGVDYRFGSTRYDFQGVDRVIVSPGIDLNNCLLEVAHAKHLEFLSDIDLFCRVATAPIVAITGTNGKSTVTSLVGHILETAGRKMAVGGNLGEAALDLLDEEAECYVLELSSFQLERMTSFRFRSATILNVTEDHLDRHGTFKSYVASKRRIYGGCEVAVANRADAMTLPESAVERLITFGLDEPEPGSWGVVLRGTRRFLARRTARGSGEIASDVEDVVAVDELAISGLHNEQNVLAAFALLDAEDMPVSALAEGARSFQGLPHRCELVCECDGVGYVNDSKATNVGATVAALEGLGLETRKRLVLIAGGEGKGADFSVLRPAVERFVKTVVLFGKDADDLQTALSGIVETVRVADMEEAVTSAQGTAETGDLVLLSPACASLDMYQNFMERGTHFSRLVGELS
ncbi:MAG: UDP-N-acetylmuramoyl-L-alanine--D-glutamate ligase [Gammaproteobacteria bacterium]|nr:UDP-N-acetylmuramoyl-L-alanine--D-glutamate ligase [Gammaproteobacteria bacterium]